MSTHILVIPGSWPSSHYSISGSFIKNDVEALAHHSSDLHFSVLYTGDSDYGVSFSQPLAFLATLT